ncbi:hypothetical protein GQ600_19518 [Phytophthora cactorum]|nr:hypothetical protein GQ600_19518 [Phytophthora cactorum]
MTRDPQTEHPEASVVPSGESDSQHNLTERETDIDALELPLVTSSQTTIGSVARNYKRVPTQEVGDAFNTCSRKSCKRGLHAACGAVVLSSFGTGSTFDSQELLQRAHETAPANIYSIEKRVPWHNDGPAPDLSSISVRIDWLTDDNSYNRYRGGDSQSGESKTTIAGKSCKPKLRQRKCRGLAKYFWTTSTAMNHVFATLIYIYIYWCSYYFELRDIMFDRASTNPQLLNTDAATNKDDA